MKFQIKKQMAALLSMAVIAVQFPHAALAETVVPDNKTIESFSVHADTASPSQAEQETDVIVKDHSDHTGYLKSGKNNEMCHITLEPVEGGYATVSKTEALPSDTIKLEAFPEPDYRFEKWEIKDSRGVWIIYPNLDKQSTEIEMWLTDITVYAKFYNINASLSDLKYQVEGSTPVDVPGFTEDQETYHVFLPPDTQENAAITLKGVPTYMQSRIIQNDGITLSGGSGTATITIQAEDPSVSKTYTVNFVPSSYGMTPLFSDLDLGTAEAGYSPASAMQPISFENTGTLPLHVTSYVWANVGAFRLVDDAAGIGLLPPGKTTSVSIQPESGLKPGVYKDKILIHTLEGIIVTVNLTFTVTEKPIPIFTVTFDPAEGTRTGGGELTQTVPEGGMAAAPVVTRDGYTFIGWDKDFSKVTSDMTVTALWKKNTVPPESGGNSSSGSSKSSSSDRGENSRPDTSELHGNWEQTVTGIWRFKMTGGSYAKNRWGQVNGVWYYFDGEGRMLTGWQYVNHQWYYLFTEEDTKTKTGLKEGALATGWYFDSAYQAWFYLGADGAMAVGQREIDGKQYYFNPESDGTKGVLQKEEETL